MATFTKQLKNRINEVKEFKKNVNKKFKNFRFLTDDYKKKQAIENKKLAASANENKKEKALWNEYKKRTLESFKKGGDNPDQKFRLDVVDSLGIDYDIFFMYSKKDIGKTTQMARRIERIRAQDPNAQICFIRNSKEELKGFAEAMNSSPNWPCWTNGEYVFWKTDLKKGRASRKEAKPCGFMAYASADGLGFVKWQGGDWDNLRFWFWDECNSVAGGLTHSVFQSVVVLLSSLNRDKRGSNRVRGYMMGNLLQKKNIFLDRLGVGPHTKLKIFDVHKDNDKNKPVLSRLLYLNTGDLFRGIEDQRGLATQFLKGNENMELLHNRPGVHEPKENYYALDLLNFKPLFCFIFSKTIRQTQTGDKKAWYICYVYKIPNAVRLVVWIDPYDETTIIKDGFKVIRTVEGVASYSFTKVVLIEEEDFADLIEFLQQYVPIGELWFGWQGSKEIFDEMWPVWSKRYLEEDEDEK